LKENISIVKKEVTPSSDPSPSKICILNPMTQKLDCIKNGVVVESIDTTISPLQGVVWDIKLDVPRGTSYNEAPAWDTLRLEYDIPIYSNLGHFVQRFHEKLSIPSSIYLSSTNTISLFVEWAPRNNYGLASADGRAVGTGAYITKVDLKTRFIPNPNQEVELKTRFSGKSSFNKTLRFGIRREK
jgi:beta-mannanase